MDAIKIENLSKTFGNFKALDNLSFNVQENRVLGFLGPNGAGKTTTIRMMVGLSKPTLGQISIGNEPVIFGQTKINHKFGYLPEQPAFYGWMTGQEYLSFVADLFKIENKKLAVQEINRVLDLVKLQDAKNRRIGGYSGGMKQRLGIAQALINRPKFLILDEPVSALDPIGRKEVLEILLNLKKDHTIFFSTHILSDVDRICDDVVIINQGKLIAVSPLSELKAKYATPVLEIEFDIEPKGVAEKFRAESWVQKVEANGNIVKVYLRDEAVMKENRPLKIINDFSYGVLKYGLNLPQTEDLFLGLIGDKQ